jgi:hypothetical protein
MHGEISFYDEPSAWGVIVGQDGRLYEFRGAQIAGPPPRLGERVLFEPQASGRRRRAAVVRRLGAAPASRPGA